MAIVAATSKDAILEALAHQFASSYDLNGAEVLERLQEREALGSTGFGRGVAIPHARVAGVSRPVAVLLKLKDAGRFRCRRRLAGRSRFRTGVARAERCGAPSCAGGDFAPGARRAHSRCAERSARRRGALQPDKQCRGSRRRLRPRRRLRRGPAIISVRSSRFTPRPRSMRCSPRGYRSFPKGTHGSNSPSTSAFITQPEPRTARSISRCSTTRRSTLPIRW